MAGAYPIRGRSDREAVEVFGGAADFQGLEPGWSHPSGMCPGDFLILDSLLFLAGEGWTGDGPEKVVWALSTPM